MQIERLDPADDAALAAAYDVECAVTRSVRPGCTSGDDANIWMQAINRSLGFVPVELEVVLRRDR